MARKAYRRKLKKYSCPYGRGDASKKIVNIIQKFYKKGDLMIKPKKFKNQVYPYLELTSKKKGDLVLYFEKGKAKFPRGKIRGKVLVRKTG